MTDQPQILTVAAAVAAIASQQLKLRPAQRQVAKPDTWSVGFCIPCERFYGEGDLLCTHMRATLQADAAHAVARIEDRAALEQIAA